VNKTEWFFAYWPIYIIDHISLTSS